MGYIMLQCHWGQCWQVKAIPHFTRCNHELYPPLHHSCVAHPPSIHVIMLPALPAAASVQLHPITIYTGAAALIYVEWGGSIFRVRVQSSGQSARCVNHFVDGKLLQNASLRLKSDPKHLLWAGSWHSPETASPDTQTIVVTASLTSSVTSSATTWCLVTWRHTTVVTWSRVWARRGSTPHIKLPKCPLSLLWVDVDEGCK